MKRGKTVGFTLIEVIVTMVILALAMAAILPFLDRVFLLSHEPRTTLQNGLSLQTAMEYLVSWDAAHTNNPVLLNQYVAAQVGTYMGQAVATNRFIAFTNGVENLNPANNNLLKITLRNVNTEEAVTRLFAVPP